jgi:hypothetical protein
LTIVMLSETEVVVPRGAFCELMMRQEIR